jgi:starvation-inducible DNA-binding protein
MTNTPKKESITSLQNVPSSTMPLEKMSSPSHTLIGPSMGISQETTHKSVHILCQYFADSFSLYFKTHSFHWNVTGPYFYSLHKLFEDQYDALFESLDEIAERIRSLGAFVPTHSKTLKSLTSLEEGDPAHPPRDMHMLRELLADHISVCNNLRQGIEELSDTKDFGTADFLTTRLEAHEKMAWMLRSHLESHHPS